jgi:GTP-binding protein
MDFNEAVFVGSFYDAKQIPRTGFSQIAFAGRSNVGKSSLINRILNRKNLAQVAKTPGKTRALNFYEINRRFYFVDLPGYGFAKIAREEQLAWRKLIDSYLDHVKDLQGVVHIIDSRRGLQEDDLSLIEYFGYTKTNILWVLSKSDKLSTGQKSATYQDVLARLHCSPKELIFFSAQDGTGVAELRKLVAEMLKNDQ